MVRKAFKLAGAGCIAVIFLVASFLLVVKSAPSLTGVHEAHAAATAPVTAAAWAAPLADLIKLLVSKFRSDDNKADVEDLIKTLELDVKALKPLPFLLLQTRDFRRKALDLNSQVLMGGRSEAKADSLWNQINDLTHELGQKYDSVYGVDSARAILSSTSGFQEIYDNAKQALSTMNVKLSSVTPTSTSLRKQAALKDSEVNLKDITTLAQFPEYLTVERITRMIDGYDELVTDVKKTLGSPKAKVLDATDEGKILPISDTAATLRAREPAPPGKPQRKEKPRRDPEYLVKLRSEISKPVPLPSWALPERSTAMPAKQVDRSALVFMATAACIAFGGAGGISGWLLHRLRVVRKIQQLALTLGHPEHKEVLMSALKELR
ncbi:MAG: hypothetical protein E6K68_08325 [Nitrospirae bacterium]|nr:MAG: hypothetical protein E6K68_08325 [Nitrospirota bacterium]